MVSGATAFAIGGATRCTANKSVCWPPLLCCAGKEPEVKAIHAGLECGIIGEKLPGLDCVSYGPTIT